MRILFATHNYPRRAGDHAGAFVARLAESLAAGGHDVRVVAPHAPGSDNSEALNGVQVDRFRYGPDALETVAYRGDLHRRQAFDPRALLGIPAMLGAFGLAVRGAVRAHAPDVIHAHWWFPAGTFATWSATAAGHRIPVVVTCHGSDVRLLDRGGAVGALGKRTLTNADAVTCVSQFLQRDVERAVPQLAGRVQTIYMPVDAEAFERARGAAKRAQPPRILFVGNLVPSKGVDVLIAAFGMLRARGVEARLRIVGGGSEQRNLEEAARTAGVVDDIDWAGFVAHDRIADEYATATVLVLPSRGQGEGLGLVLAEALLCGTSVVASPAGGIPEVVVDEVTGLIARDGDCAHLARQLERLLRDDALRTRLVDAGVQHVRSRFGREASVAAFERVYRRVLRSDS